MKKSLLFLPVLTALPLMSCTMTGSSNATLNASQTYAVGCIPAINAVAAAVGGMPIPDPDFAGVEYRFAQRGSTELTILARSNVLPRETWSEWTCTENGGKATLSVKTSGLNTMNASKLHQQFFNALNLPRP